MQESSRLTHARAEENVTAVEEFWKSVNIWRVGRLLFWPTQYTSELKTIVWRWLYVAVQLSVPRQTLWSWSGERLPGIHSTELSNSVSK